MTTLTAGYDATMSDPTDLPQASSESSEADADHGAGDTAPDERSVAGIDDDQLPEDVRPGEDNPLAEPLDPDDPETRSPDELGMHDVQDDSAGDSSGDSAGEDGQAGIPEG